MNIVLSVGYVSGIGLALTLSPVGFWRTKDEITRWGVDKSLNCWEYMLCGREPGGVNIDKLGICPSATDKRFDGIHRGENAGRACWVVAGSVQKENIQCPYAKKHKNCGMCDFYQIVKKEEGERLRPTIMLIRVFESQSQTM